ncbi:MAG: hypothetical protein H0V44_12020 [Planctomycetes bacterium]|nr:hypothetical protein [Planctomycetota bacterium]
MDAMYWCLVGGGAAAVLAAVAAIVRSGAQVKLPSADGNFVPFYDFKTRSVSYIRKEAVRPGMVQVKIHNLEGLHWVDAKQMKQEKIAPLGELSEAARAKLASIREVLTEVHPMTLEQWEALVRRDADPEAAVATWETISADYRSESANPSYNAIQRLDVFHVVVACATSTRDQALATVTLAALARTTAEGIVARHGRSEVRQGTGRYAK